VWDGISAILQIWLYFGFRFLRQRKSVSRTRKYDQIIRNL